MAVNQEELKVLLDQHDGSTVEGAAARLKIMREAANPPEENSEETESEEEEVPEEEESDERLFDSDNPEEEEAEEDESLPILDAPEGFTTQEREAFAEFDAEAQKAIIRMEQARQRGVKVQVDKVQTEAKRLQEEAAEVAKMREEYVKRLEATTDVSNLRPNPDLLDEDHDDYNPQEFYRQQAKYDRAKIKAEQDTEKLNEERGKMEAERRELLKKDVAVHTEILLERFPDWAADHEAGKKELAEVKAYATSGRYPTFTEEVINPLYNSDILTALWKARKYDEMTGKIDKKSRKTPPKTVKSAKRGKPVPSLKAVKEAEERHKRERTVESAAALTKARREHSMRNR